jgi:hypothetical protein
MIIREVEALNELKKNPFSRYPEEDGLIAYFRIETDDSGLSVDIAADSGNSFKARKHPLWVYVQCEPGANFYEKSFHVTVEPHPRILGTNAPIKLNREQINDIKKFIVKNQQILKDIAVRRIKDYRDFFNQIIPLNDIRIHESVSGSSLICEMANFLKNQTGLPVNVWVDTLGSYKKGGHAERIKFQNSKANHVIDSELVPISVHGGMEIYTDEVHINLSRKELNLIRRWIEYNRENLIKVINGELKVPAFTANLIKIDAKGLPIHPSPPTEENNNLS